MRLQARLGVEWRALPILSLPSYQRFNSSLDHSVVLDMQSNTVSQNHAKATKKNAAQLCTIKTNVPPHKQL